MCLGEGSEYDECLLELPLDIEGERFLESLYHGDLFAGDSVFGSDEFVDEDGFLFPFDLDIVEFAEYEELFCLLGDAFSDADERTVDFIDPLESGGSIDGITEGGVFDFLSRRSDIADDCVSFVDPHTYAYLESVILLELDIEFSNFILLFDGGTASEDGLFFFVSEGSPERHNCVSFVFVNESFLWHDDIGNFFEIDAQEVDELFRFHIFGDTCEPGDIWEETRDSLSFPSEFYFFVIFEDIDNEILCEVLWESAAKQTLPFFFPNVLVSGNKNSDEKDDYQKLNRMGEKFMKCDEIEYLSEKKDNESNKGRDKLINTILREEREKCEEKCENNDEENFRSFLHLDDICTVEDRVDHIGMNIDTVLDTKGGIEFIVQGGRGRSDENDLVFYYVRFVGPVVGIHKRNLLEPRGFRYVINIHITCFIGGKRDEFISENITLEPIYICDIFGIDERLFSIDDIEVFSNNTERKSLPWFTSLYIHWDDTVYNGIILVEFGMKISDWQGVL